MSRIKRTLVALTLVGASFVFVGSALASSKDGGTASSSVTAVEFKQVVLKGLVVVDEHIKVDHKSPSKGARWFKTCTNTSYVLGQYHGSHIVGYQDHHCLLQPDSHSPTGWVKRGGGATNRDCRNIAAPPSVAVHYPMVKHFVSVASLAAVYVKVYVVAKAHAEIHASCGVASGDGYAADWITANYAAYTKSRGSLQLREVLAASIVARAKDAASAKATVTCAPPTTTPPPAQVCTDTNASNYGGPLPCKYPPPAQVCTDTNASNYGGPLPCKYPPPVVQPPSLSNPVYPEEVQADGQAYRNICVTVSAKNGNSITVMFGAGYGHFTETVMTITSQGVDRVCTTYVAPVDSTAVGKQEVITYDAHDNTTGLNAQQVKSAPFPIKASPPQI